MWRKMFFFAFDFHILLHEWIFQYVFCVIVVKTHFLLELKREKKNDKSDTLVLEW